MTTGEALAAAQGLRSKAAEERWWYDRTAALADIRASLDAILAALPPADEATLCEACGERPARPVNPELCEVCHNAWLSDREEAMYARLARKWEAKS